MKVYIGYDEREHRAAAVCMKSLLDATRGEIDPEFLSLGALQSRGLLTRLNDKRTLREYDLTSNAHYSTRFNIARFLVPILCQGGMSLFVDCDMVFERDPREMLREAPSRLPLSVVKHEHEPTRSVKMMEQAQNAYPRKNWSSVMLFNCDHPANRRLSLWDVNHRTRQELHSLYWLHDDEIGSLSPSWNWLVNEQPKPDNLGIAHFTNGGPFNDGWPGAEHDDLWLKHAGG